MRSRIKRIWKFILKGLALFTVDLLILFFISGIFLYIFLKIATELVENELKPFDTSVYNFLMEYSSDGMDTFMKTVTFANNMEFGMVLGVLIFVFFAFIKPHRWYSIKIPVISIGAIGSNIFLKDYFQRPRPELMHMVDVSGMSFPSGHAMYSISFYGLLIYIVFHRVKNKYLRWGLITFLFLLIMFIGISRVYLGVHFASDVLAGFAAGTLWLILALLILKGIENYVHKEEKEFISHHRKKKEVMAE